MSLLIPAILSQSPAAAPGAIAYESMGDVLEIPTGGHTTSTESLDMPSSLAAGDLLVAVVVYRGNSAPISYPAGWTDHPNANMHNTDWSVHISIGSHSVVTPGSEPGSITITGGLLNYPIGGAILRFSNGASVDAVAGYNDGLTTPTDHIAPDVTPTAASGILLSALITREGNTHTITSPATILLDGVMDNNDVGFGLSYAASSGTSPQGSATFTTSATKASALATVALH